MCVFMYVYCQFLPFSRHTHAHMYHCVSLSPNSGYIPAYMTEHKHSSTAHNMYTWQVTWLHIIIITFGTFIFYCCCCGCSSRLMDDIVILYFSTRFSVCYRRIFFSQSFFFIPSKLFRRPFSVFVGKQSNDNNVNNSRTRSTNIYFNNYSRIWLQYTEMGMGDFRGRSFASDPFKVVKLNILPSAMQSTAANSKQSHRTSTFIPYNNVPGRISTICHRLLNTELWKSARG